MLFCAGFVWLLHPLCSYTYMCAFLCFYLFHLLLLNETKSASLFIHDFWQPCCTHSACQLCETGSKDFSCHYCSCVENQKLLDIITDFTDVKWGVPSYTVESWNSVLKNPCHVGNKVGCQGHTVKVLMNLNIPRSQGTRTHVDTFAFFIEVLLLTVLYAPLMLDLNSEIWKFQVCFAFT